MNLPPRRNVGAFLLVQTKFFSFLQNQFLFCGDHSHIISQNDAYIYLTYERASARLTYRSEIRRWQRKGS